jgi:hypothetical protein
MLRNNKSLVQMANRDPEKAEQSKSALADYQSFLASGGKVQEVPAGFTVDGLLSLQQVNERTARLRNNG